MDTKPTPDGGPIPPDVFRELADLVARAGQGDEGALLSLQTLLRKPELWRHAAELAAAATATWPEHLAAEGIAIDALVTDEPGVLPTASTGNEPPNLEGLLGEYIAVCRLHVAYTKHRAAQPTPSPGVNTVLTRRATAAQRRLRLAAKRLELVRRLVISVSGE